MLFKTPSLDKIQSLIRARFPLIWIRSIEERRVEEQFKALIPQLSLKGKELWVWTLTEGAQNLSVPRLSPTSDEYKHPSAIIQYILNKAIENPDKGRIWLVKDFHPFLTPGNPEIIRRARDAGRALLNTMTSVIFLSPLVDVPPELRGDIQLIDFALPRLDEAIEIVTQRTNEAGNLLKAVPEKEYLRSIAEACLGMTATQIDGVISRSIVDNREIDLTFILQEKEEVIKMSGLLEYIRPDTDLSAVGGLGALKKWIQKRKGAFTEKAREFGLPHPRGLLLLGVQGCGKSLICKALGGELQLPILRLDAGRLFQGIVGRSEANAREAIALAEAVAPCILFIDEIEKGFSGIGSSNFSDGGTTARVFGTVISWLQDKTAPVFVLATSNNISQLPPELIRKGRFDELYFIDLPTQEERVEVFRIHIAEHGRNPEEYDLAELAAEADSFSGAEIKEVVISALFDAFADQDEDGVPCELSVEGMLKSIRETLPLAVTMKEELASLRKWASARTRSASLKPIMDSAMGSRRLEM